MKTLEEISLNAWPSLQQMLYDGWVLRFADGYTKRANSVNSVYIGTKDVYEKIAKCEQIYTDRNLDTIFRITPLACPENLDIILADAGFKKQDISSVQVMNLAYLPQTSLQAKLWTEFSQEWLDSFARLSNLPAGAQESLVGILRNIVSKKCFAILVHEEQVVSCGLGVLEDQYIGLFEVVTATDQQRRGFGKEVMLNILNWAQQNGAKKAYLQVVIDNKPALSLYSKLGFQEVYQYFYRIKPTE